MTLQRTPLVGSRRVTRTFPTHNTAPTSPVMRGPVSIKGPEAKKYLQSLVIIA